MAHASSLWIGKDLCHGHKLRRLVGQGGYGTVWEAESPEGEKVALKFLLSDDDTTATNEVKAILRLRQLVHPNLTPIRQVWSEKGYIIIAMPLADGSLMDLYDACQAEYGTPMSRDEICPLLMQVAAGLDFLNARRHLLDGVRVAFQHCDVKPSNVLLFGDTAKLCDFGLASQTGFPLKPHRRAGTQDFAAPEVFQGRLSDHTDQYALAVTYCLLRGGRMPFPSPPKQFARDYVRPEPDLTMLPPAERAVVARALAVIPQERWPSCNELIQQLRKCP